MKKSFKKANGMKKILSALFIGALLFSSCQKQEEKTPQVRQFSYSMSYGSMYTKAVNAEDVLNAINATLPEQLNIYLTSQTTSKVFSGKTGEGIVLPSDTYNVIGAYNGQPVSSVVFGSSAYLASNPKIDINQQIVVTDEETQYTLKGTYQCFALVVDASEVERAEISTASGVEEINFISSGGIKIVFAQGDFSSHYLSITIYPKDTSYETTTFNFSTKSGTNLFAYEWGKYYVLHPTIGGNQPKVVSLDLPSFVEGTL